MGFFDNMNEAAAKQLIIQNEKLKQEIVHFLIEGEEIEDVFPLFEDFLAFTNKRLLFVDKSLTSSKKCITSLPYDRITSVALEKGGFMHFSKNIEIRVGNKSHDIRSFYEEKALSIYKKINQKIL